MLKNTNCSLKRPANINKKMGQCKRLLNLPCGLFDHIKCPILLAGYCTHEHIFIINIVHHHRHVVIISIIVTVLYI